MTSSRIGAYTVANREDAINFMADCPDYGEQRWYTPQTAVRVASDAFRSVHNDTDGDAELLIFSPRRDEPPTDKKDDFWPSA